MPTEPPANQADPPASAAAAPAEDAAGGRQRAASVIIPAHNEERVIGRLLTRLLDGAEPGEFDVVVVCNGCTDATADAAKRAAAAYEAADVRVVDIPEASKHLALRRGDAEAHGFPRLYVDADVEVDAASVRALAAAVAEPGVLAAGPERRTPLDGRAWRVRAYYRVWEELPVVREGLFGRGVIALSAAGYERIAALPDLTADDLAVSLSFAPAERRIVRSAVSTVHPPRTWDDLMRRRIRAMTGADEAETRMTGGASGERTSPKDLLGVLAAKPSLAASMPVFVGVAVLARRRAAAARRAGRGRDWLRDESSRT